MKIRPSLRRYFLGSILVTGIVTIAAMAYVSYHFYFLGVDFSISDVMRTTAHQAAVSDGKPQELNGFTVATRWEDLPAAVRSHLDESEMVDERLLKFVDGNPLFSPPKARYFAIRLNRGGEQRYVSSMFVSDSHTLDAPKDPPDFLYIFAIALVAISLFSLVPVLLLKKVATPIERLTTWAKDLGREALDKPAPKFHYSELDSLAQLVLSSLRSVQESVEREKLFLGYASHELRTPIAVTRANSELLRKMIDKGISSTRQLEVLGRIERAGLTMTDLTETLLWLNRHSEKSLPTSPVELDGLIEKLVEELSYLLSGKTVDVAIRCEPTVLALPEALCRIVISNLIRNAFQYTWSGRVDISLTGKKLEILNINEADEERNDELGFGLGLELTERLVDRQGWGYSNKETGAGRHVVIEFDVK
ncbi:sensor histidine kinase [Parazoarcus communis]|uniref:histidine kinase n=1 Tax=Parazoarcus communis TaxID=41977 RepID=A0A2U8H661_9RHOO|nr:HAMP domain-containing sensor histidine kinase [Parazoarcus communis]AWI80646.1 sensor histidine kinase [Parazoarcus communis]